MTVARSVCDRERLGNQNLLVYYNISCLSDPSTMPILIATAAGAAATYGAYRGGKAAVQDVKRKRSARKSMREERAERNAEIEARREAAEERKTEAAELSVKERLERYKHGVDEREGKANNKKKGLLGRLRKSKE